MILAKHAIRTVNMRNLQLRMSKNSMMNASP